MKTRGCQVQKKILDNSITNSLYLNRQCYKKVDMYNFNIFLFGRIALFFCLVLYFFLDKKIIRKVIITVFNCRSVLIAIFYSERFSNCFVQFYPDDYNYSIFDVF